MNATPTAQQAVIAAARAIVDRWRSAAADLDVAPGEAAALEDAVTTLEQIEAEACPVCHQQPSEPGGHINHLFHPKDAADQVTLTQASAMFSGEFFFSETVTAHALAPWHIRPAGDKGRCPGGGADTAALCGRVVAWDLDLEVTDETVARVGPCARCAAAFRLGRELHTAAGGRGRG